MLAESFLNYSFVFLLPFLVVAIITPILTRLSLGIGAFVDLPSDRRVHVTPVPRVGGLGVFIGIVVALLTLHWLPWLHIPIEKFTQAWAYSFLLPTSLIFLVGLIDDYRGIPPLLKLGGQIAAALLAFVLGISMGQFMGFSLPPYLDLVFTIVWFLGIINAFNLIDGIDGLATGLGIISLFAIAAVLFYLRQPAETLAVIGIIGACAGFLLHNFRSAKIFLGDGGSHLIGFTVAALSLSTNTKSASIATFGVMLLAIGVPAFDVLLAIWRRGTRKYLNSTDSNSSISAPDLEHLHHRLLHSGRSHSQVSLRLYTVSLLLVSIGLLVLFNKERGLGISLVAFLIVVYIMLQTIAKVELWDSGKLLLQGLQRSRRGLFFALSRPILDGLGLCIALAVCAFLTLPELSLSDLKQLWFSKVTVWATIPLIGLFVSGNYNIVWSRARISSYIFTALTLIFCILICLAIDLTRSPSFFRHQILFMSLFAGFTLAAVLSIRAIPNWVRDMMALFASSNEAKANSESVLIYGAKTNAELYLQHRYRNLEQSRNEYVVGFIDDDVNIRGRMVYGFPVLGVSAEMPQVLTKYNVDKIVMTITPPKEQLGHIRELAFDMDRDLSLWTFTEDKLVQAEG